MATAGRFYVRDIFTVSISLVVVPCLQMTKQAGSWIPRLERMVQSRNLSNFEKSVLLTLIGGVIQPNKVHSWWDTVTSTTGGNVASYPGPYAGLGLRLVVMSSVGEYGVYRTCSSLTLCNVVTQCCL